MNPVKAIIKDQLKSAGFRCQGNTWYRRRNDLIQALNIQKSAWGDQYYINLRFDYFDGSFKYPSEYKFHNTFDLDFRASSILKEADFKAFDFENEYDPKKRTDTVRDIISQCIDLLDKCNSTSAMKEDFMDICRLHLRVGTALQDVVLG